MRALWQQRATTGANPRRRGSTLFLALVTITMLAGLALGYLVSVSSQTKDQVAANQHLSAFYSAEAGLNESYASLSGGDSGQLGSAEAPVAFGAQSFWVDAVDNGDGTTSLRATGKDGEFESHAELVVSTAPLGTFQFAAFADEELEIDSNAFVDSYDSTKGSYASQVTGGFALENGDIGSNSDIYLDSNATIHGAGQYGPDTDDTITLGSSVTITGGYGQASSEIALPAVTVPTIASSGSLEVKRETVTIGPGDIHYDEIVVNSNSDLKIVGPARIVVDSLDVGSNTTIELNASGGPLELYGTGRFVLDSNSKLTSIAGSPADVSVFLTAVHDSADDSDPKIALDSNAEFYGTILAPEASVALDSNLRLYGAVMAKWLELNSNAQVHYDESLRYDTSDGDPTFDVLLWRPLSTAQFSLTY
jgi:hypothetical protein